MLDNFRAHDAEKAQVLIDSVEKSIEEIQAFFKGGHLGAAEITADDLHKALVDICKLAHAKREHDRLVKLARKLQQKNISAEVIKCYTACSM